VRRASVLLVCLTLASWTLPAQEQPSQPQQMVPLQTCLDELTALEAKCTEQLTQLENDCAERLRQACEQAAADALRPALVELAGVRAERDVYRSVMETERYRKGVWRAVAVGGIIGTVGFGALTVVALLLQPLPPVH